MRSVDLRHLAPEQQELFDRVVAAALQEEAAAYLQRNGHASFELNCDAEAERLWWLATDIYCSPPPKKEH